MVYYDEGGSVDPQAAKLAIIQADRYITERAAKDKTPVTIIDYASVDKARQDRTAFSAGSARELAARLGADVYVEINASISSESRDGKFYASAQGGMRIYETLTRALLGDLPFPNQTALSSSSQAAAASNALVASVWVSMPRLYDQARALLAATFDHGVRYELVVRKASDAQKVAAFEQTLGERVTGLLELSTSPGETRLELYSFQKADALERLIAAAAIRAGMPAVGPVALDGSAFAFDAGR